MSDKPQLTLAEVRTLPSDQVNQALREGRCDSLLRGEDPGPPPSDDDDNDDQADEDPDRQLTRDDLTTMSTEEIAAALRAGRFDRMLSRT